jgi:hypothetical protein
MCHEWMWRRQREAEESREVWADFERSTPVAEPQAAPEQPEPARAEGDEEVVAAER